MEKFEISVSQNGEHYHFEIRDYMHHKEDQCKYEVYREGQFIASFEPGSHRILNICKNPGIVPEDILHLIADRLESSPI